MLREPHAMNLGPQTGALVSTVTIINSLDEATRERVLSELPEELKRRLVEQHTASLLAARLGYNGNSAQQMLASGYLNDRSAPEVGHSLNLVKMPVANLAALKTSAAAASNNYGFRNPGPSPNHGTPVVHHITTRLPGDGVSNVGCHPSRPSGSSSHGVIASHGLGVTYSGASQSQSMKLGPVTSGSFGVGASLGVVPGGPGTSHGFNPRMAVAHNASSMHAARQMVNGSPMAMQMGLVPSGSMHITNSPRFAASPGSFPTVMNQHVLRHKPVMPTFLDEFKQGFPSKGLSITSNRWWGGAEADKTLGHTENSVGRNTHTAAVGGVEGPSFRFNRRKDNDKAELLKACRKITKSRKLAAVSSKRALKEGMAKVYGGQKLEHSEAAILQFVFGDTLLRKCSSALPASG